MTNAFEILTGPIQQCPEQLKPIMTQLGNMIKGNADALVSHVGDNNDTNNAITSAASLLDDRIKNLEINITTVNTTIVQVSKRVEDLESKLGSSAALEASPTVKGIRDDMGAAK